MNISELAKKWKVSEITARGILADTSPQVTDEQIGRIAHSHISTEYFGDALLCSELFNFARALLSAPPAAESSGCAKCDKYQEQACICTKEAPEEAKPVAAEGFDAWWQKVQETAPFENLHKEGAREIWNAALSAKATLRDWEIVKIAEKHALPVATYQPEIISFARCFAAAPQEQAPKTKLHSDMSSVEEESMPLEEALRRADEYERTNVVNTMAQVSRTLYRNRAVSAQEQAPADKDATAEEWPQGWRFVEKKTCYQIHDGHNCIANLVGPDAEENAKIIARILATATTGDKNV